MRKWNLGILKETMINYNNDFNQGLTAYWLWHRQGLDEEYGGNLLTVPHASTLQCTFKHIPVKK